MLINFVLDLFAQLQVNVLFLSWYLFQHLKINNNSCDIILSGWHSSNMMLETQQICYKAGVLGATSTLVQSVKISKFWLLFSLATMNDKMLLHLHFELLFYVTYNRNHVLLTQIYCPSPKERCYKPFLKNCLPCITTLRVRSFDD